MSINYNVYGAPETWHDCYFGGGSTQAWATMLHGEKAKVPTWDSAHPSDPPTFENSQLRYAVDDNKLSPTEPIDKTVCAVGQGRSSPFRQFTIFRCDETTEHQSGEILQVGHAYTTSSYNDLTTPINSFWFESNSFTSNGNYGNGAFSRGRLQIKDGATVTQGLDQRIWSPSGVNSHGTNKQNGNFYIAPFLKYGSRSYILQILVWVTTANYDPDFTPGTGTPAGEWKTLDDWKNNYSNKAIVACLLAPRSISTYDSSTGNIGYYRINYESSQYRKVSNGILDTIKFEFDDASSLPDLTAYGLFTANSNANVGIALFNEMTLLKWSDTLQNIGLVNSYIASYIRSNGTFMTPYIPYSEDIYEWIMEACACFGMAFTPGKNKATDASNCRFNQDFLDNDLCLPIIDGNGVAHGDYTRGSDNADNDFIDLSSQWDKNYDPVNPEPIDPNTYSNTTGFNSIAAGASATIKYVLDSSNVRQLLADLWTISHTIAGVDYEKYDYKILDSFLVSNPIDSIVSIKRFPFEIPHTFSTQKTNVCLGKNTGSSQGYVTHNVFNTVIFSGVQIFPKFGNSFLDYAPYTEYELYIPFCGTVKLNAGDILGHTLNCRLQIDLTTGSCTAYILADDLVIETASGVVSCELQVAGTDSATVDSAIQNAVINHIGARTNKEIAMLSPLTFGGLLSVVSNPVKTSGAMENANNEISRADYNLTHIQTPVHSMGNAGGLTGWYQEFNARLIIYYPEGEAIDSSAPVSSTSPHLADLTAYAHNVGFACVMNGTVSEFHGKTVANIDTSSIVGATEEERAQIKALFAQGVWLP